MDSVSRRRELARSYLAKLDEDTMLRAWGDTPEVARRHIVVAAITFGEVFEERIATAPDISFPQDQQRFLMALMNEVVARVSETEGESQSEMAAFLGEVSTRDRVFEMNEVIEEYEDSEGISLDGILSRNVEERIQKSRDARYWQSG